MSKEDVHTSIVSLATSSSLLITFVIFGRSSVVSATMGSPPSAILSSRFPEADNEEDDDVSAD